MGNKFTPGPWKIRSMGAKMIESERGRIAAVLGIDCGFYLPGDVNEANARLIAAAPEMYELLEKLQFAGNVLENQRDEIRSLLTRINTPS